MAFAEDMSPYFDTDTGYGVACLFNGSLTVNCLFDNAYGDVLGAGGTVPTITGPTASLAAIERGDTVVVASVSYTITNVEPDATGVTVLRLERV